MDIVSSRTSALGIRHVCSMTIGWMILTTVVVSFPHVWSWVAGASIIIFVLLLGFLWAIVFGIKPAKSSEYVLHALGLGLAYITIGGLIINWLLPHVGISQPLAFLPVIIFFDLSLLILCVCAYYFRKNFAIVFSEKQLDKASLFFGIFPLIFVVMSVCGALRLNDGTSGVVTLIMLFGIAIYVLVLVCRNKPLHTWTYLSAIYCMSLSLLLMYSLRSAHILGWDINQEYQVFQTTLAHLRWKMSYYPGLDYNACASITIVPTIFQVLTRIPSEYIFKAFFQLFFAATPVIVYSLARRYLRESLSFLSAFLLVSQRWFFEQMPALIRQEIAFVFYALLLLTLFDTRISARIRYVLFGIYTAALVISHYSTAYVWVTLLVGTLVLWYLARWVLPKFKQEFKPKFESEQNSFTISFSIIIVAISILILFLWEIPITHSTGTASNFVSHASTGIAITPITSATTGGSGKTSATGSRVSTSQIGSAQAVVQKDLQSGMTASLFVDNNPNTIQSIALAEQSALYMYSKQAGVYSAALAVGYVPSPTDTIAYTQTLVPKQISAVLNMLTEISKVLLIDLLPLVGIIGMYIWIRRRHKSSQKYVRDYLLGYLFVILNIAAYGFIVLMVLIPYLQVYYNLTRLYLQMFFSLSIMSIIGGVFIVKYLSFNKKIWMHVLLTSIVVVLFCSLSGAFDQITGGQARITLDQPPGAFDTYYIHNSEIAGVDWLVTNRQVTDPVQADIIANLRLQSFGNMNADNVAIFPQTLQQNSYVYLTTENIAGIGYDQYNNNLLTYNYPTSFLNTHKNLIYNDGGSRIYR